jgi:hypothetical protein
MAANRVGFLLFAGFYGLLHVVVVPPLAALGGRVPLPCAAEPDRPFAAAHPLFCRLDRHYVDPRLVVLMTTMSREIAREYPGTITLYLDGNFPFLNGFPLLPHLSHSDGRKLDIAYYYRGPDAAIGRANCAPRSATGRSSSRLRARRRRRAAPERG